MESQDLRKAGLKVTHPRVRRTGAGRALMAEALRRLGELARVLVDRGVLLARDDLGTTPLYYIANAHGFAFATRIADARAAMPVDTSPNRKALAALLVDYAGPGPGEGRSAQRPRRHAP